MRDRRTFIQAIVCCGRVIRSPKIATIRTYFLEIFTEHNLRSIAA